MMSDSTAFNLYFLDMFLIGHFNKIVQDKRARGPTIVTFVVPFGAKPDEIWYQ